MRPLIAAGLTRLPLFAVCPPSTADTVLFEDLSGGTSLGSITGRNAVSFTPNTAVFSPAHDGIMYPSNLFPAEGVIEVRLRVDDVAYDPLRWPVDFGTISIPQVWMPA